jgi:hypothetical protein
MVATRTAFSAPTGEAKRGRIKDPIQAFSLDGPREAFGIRIGVGCTGGRLRDVNAGVTESLADVVAPFAVAIADHHAMRDEEALLCRQ